MQQPRWEDLPKKERIKRSVMVCSVAAAACVLVWSNLGGNTPHTDGPAPTAASAPVSAKVPPSPEARKAAWAVFANEAKMRLDYSDSLTMAITVTAKTSNNQAEIYRTMKDGYLNHASIKPLLIPGDLADDAEVARIQDQVMTVMAVRGMAFKRGMEYLDGDGISAAAEMQDRLERMKAKVQQTRGALGKYAESHAF